jgi:hypothetical protein
MIQFMDLKGWQVTLIILAGYIHIFILKFAQGIEFRDNVSELDYLAIIILDSLFLFMASNLIITAFTGFALSYTTGLGQITFLFLMFLIACSEFFTSFRAGKPMLSYLNFIPWLRDYKETSRRMFDFQAGLLLFLGSFIYALISNQASTTIMRVASLGILLSTNQLFYFFKNSMIKGER